MSGQGDMFDLNEGRKRRDESMDRVENPGFTGHVIRVLGHIIGRHVTGEDIRRICGNHGVHAHHSNAWGGVIAGLVKGGRLKATGEYRQMEDTRSHARETKVYEVL